MTRINYKGMGLTAEEESVLDEMYASSPAPVSELEDIWSLMDVVWETLGCDKLNPDGEAMGEFYAHPVWLLNGLFTESDPESIGHRHSISDWLLNNAQDQQIEKVLDFGGGYGFFSRLLADKAPEVKIDIFEPHPTRLALEKSSEYANLGFVEEFPATYDAIIVIDVMEHLADPLETMFQISQTVREGGIVVFANCFYPVIQCHLPRTFYLRYTFGFFARFFGMIQIGRLPGCHAVAFRKESAISPNWNKIRFYEALSRKVFPVINLLENTARKIKGILLCG